MCINYTYILKILLAMRKIKSTRLLISYMQVNSEANLQRQVDKNNYNQQDLIIIKTKLDLPYYSSSPEYERALEQKIIFPETNSRIFAGYSLKHKRPPKFFSFSC